MRLAALVDVLRARPRRRQGLPDRPGLQLRPARGAPGAARCCARSGPTSQIVGEELHPVGRVKDFLPYAAKIKASGAQAVLTGNWGNDLTLLVRALREVGADGPASTPSTATRSARRRPSARPASARCWRWPNGTRTSAARRPTPSTRTSAQRFPAPQDDYVHVRMQVLVEMLAAAIERAGSTEAAAVARALEGARFDAGTPGRPARGRDARRRPPAAAAPGGQRDGPCGRAGRGARRSKARAFGFRTLRRLAPAQVSAAPCLPHGCGPAVAPAG